MENKKLKIARKLVYVGNDWYDILVDAMAEMDYTYLKFLETNKEYIPDKNVFLNAFQRLSYGKTRYVLFGQDPYPRKESAIGEAFIDGAVTDLWSATGLSKAVNRATSLRNIMKMLLLTHGYLSDSGITQKEIAKIDKTGLISSILDLRDNFVKNGVLLLNTSLVFTSSKDTMFHTAKWKPFIRRILAALDDDVVLILLGNFAKRYVGGLTEARKFKKVEFDHPFNMSFVRSSEVQSFFKRFGLIYKD